MNGASLNCFSTISISVRSLFHFMPWTGHQFVIFRSSLTATGFTTPRTLSDWGIGYRLMEVGDKPGAFYPVQPPLVQMGLPVAQCLETALETDNPNRKIRCLDRIQHQPPDTVVGDKVHQDFFPDHVRRPAPQDVYPHGRLDVAEKQLDIPALEVKIGKFSSGIVRGIQKRGDDVKVPNPEARIGYRNLDLPQRPVLSAWRCRNNCRIPCRPGRRRRAGRFPTADGTAGARGFSCCRWRS